MVKKLGCASFFQPTSQCLEIWWNTLPLVWYITSYLISLSGPKFTLFWFTWHNHQKLLIKCLFLSRQFFCFFSNKEFFFSRPGKSFGKPPSTAATHQSLTLISRPLKLQRPETDPLKWWHHRFFLSCHVEALRDETKSDRDGERFVD